MRRIGLLAFGITTSLLVPAVLHTLDAGPTQVAKLLAPGSGSLKIGDTKIDVTIDKSFVDPGDKVKVNLVATGGERATVDVLVLEAQGSGGGRVESPPKRIARQTVTLKAGASQELAFKLSGFRGRGMEGMDPYGHYTILVMPPKAADAFERLRKKADKANPMIANGDPDDSYSKFEIAWGSIGQPDTDDAGSAEAKPSTFGAADSIARLEVQTRPTNSPVTIKSPASHKQDDAFTVSVTVKNPSRRRHKEINLELLSKPAMMYDAYLGLAADMVTIEEPTRKLDLGPHESKTLTFEVTAKSAGVLGLFATTHCDDCEWKDPQSDVALEAVDITPETPAVVGTR